MKFKPLLIVLTSFVVSFLLINTIGLCAKASLAKSCYDVCLSMQGNNDAFTWCDTPDYTPNYWGEDIALPRKKFQQGDCQSCEYRLGQLYWKVSRPDYDVSYLRERDGLSANNDTRSISALIEQYGITQIQKAFPRLPKLSQIYRITFTETNKTQELLDALNAHRLTQYAEKIPVHKKFLTPNDIHPDQYNVLVTDCEQAWNISTGNSNIVIGMVDDAVRTTHEDLAANIWVNPGEVAGNGIDDDSNGYIDDINGWDAASNDNDPNPEGADNFSFSHGTHCAGIAAAVTNNGIGVASVSYNVKLMAIKTALSGSGAVDAGFEGVEYAIASGADVISMSWGGGAPSDAEQEVFDVAYDANIVCVAAAGNDNVSDPMYPASYNHVISVGATDENDNKANFSNYGATIDVMAPGVHIWSSVATSDDSYEFYDGTSMACPFVSGLAALMLSYLPTLDVDEIENCLKTTADNIDAQNPDFVGQIGAGRVNAHQAMLCIPTEPLAGFETNFIGSGCTNQPIQFYNSSGGLLPMTVQWAFENGIPATSTEENPIVFYSTNGTYDVTITVTNSLGTNTYTGTITIAPPSAALSGDAAIIAGYQAPLQLELTGTPPWDVVYSDGTNNYTLNNIMETPFIFNVSPPNTTTYTLVSVMDSYCNGSVSGSALVLSETPEGCFDCPYYLVQEVLLGGGCVSIFNVTYTGDPQALAYFEQGPNLDIGYSSGILMTTGYSEVAYGPDDSEGETVPMGGLNLPGDPDLDEVNPNFPTNDASVLEFDFVPSSSEVSFNYIFGSEEYLEFVNSSFNDVFGFFISGPGIVGNQNIALIPGTSTPVSINNVNDGLNSTYYVNTPNGSNTTQFDGHTVSLQAVANNLTPCQTYHIKLAVADAGDHVLDSGVFLEAGSFTDGAEFSVDAFGSEIGTVEAYEGCQSGYFLFSRTDTTDLSNPVTIDFNLVGTATYGIDYVAIPNSITIPAGEVSAAIFLQTILDAEEENIETATVIIDDAQCNCTTTTLAASLFIRDNEAIEAGGPHAICRGSGIQLSPTDGLSSYSWTPTIGLDDPNIQNPTASPEQTTVYHVLAVDANGCQATDSVVVYVQSLPYFPPITLDTTVCTGDTVKVKLTNIGFVSNYNYQWEPETGLDNPHIPFAMASVTESTVYTLTIHNQQGCETTQQVSVNIINNNLEISLPDTTICPGQPFTFVGPPGFGGYEWSDGSTLPTLTVNEAGTYMLAVTDNTFGCGTSTEGTLTYADEPVVSIIGETVFTEGMLNPLDAGSGYASYTWSTGEATPSINVTETGTYSVTVSNEAGCKASATISVETINPPQYVVPTAFSPNGDGVNDVFQIINSGSVQAIHMRIFNRWGNKVFESSDLNEGWNGRFKGRDSEMGTYVYFAELTLSNGEVIELKGNVTLVR